LEDKKQGRPWQGNGVEEPEEEEEEGGGGGGDDVS